MAVNIHQAKTHVSRLLGHVAEGEELEIARAGEPNRNESIVGKTAIAWAARRFHS
jgi:hypothetical protein